MDVCLYDCHTPLALFENMYFTFFLNPKIGTFNVFFEAAFKKNV